MIDMWKDEIGWLFCKAKKVVKRSRESKLLLSFVFLEWSCLDWLIHNRCKALYSLYKLNKTKYIYFNILSQLTLFNFGGLMMEICWWLVCGLLVACWWIVLVACCLWVKDPYFNTPPWIFDSSFRVQFESVEICPLEEASWKCQQLVRWIRNELMKLDVFLQLLWWNDISPWCALFFRDRPGFWQ